MDCAGPKIILMDEPTSSLDFGNQLRTVRMIHALAQRGYAVVMTTHNPDHAIMLDDTVGILDRDGRMVTGRTKEVLSEQLLSQVYPRGRQDRARGRSGARCVP